MIFYPNAKINIGLRIINKRPDGFHNLESFMLPIGLHDELNIEPTYSANKKIALSIKGMQIDGSLDDNLICRAYRLIDADLNLPPVSITLQKNIPTGAGLGGGSADCAFTITGLNKLFNLGLSVEKMQQYAAQLGSDCALFVENKPALAYSRGEVLKPVDVNLAEYKLMLVLPQIHVSTGKAYSLITPAEPTEKVADLYKLNPNEWPNRMINDFEAPIFDLYPQLAAIKQRLYDLGAEYASMSGSGSSVYGIFKQLPQTLASDFEGCFVWKGNLTPQNFE